MPYNISSRSLASSVVALKELETGDYIWKVGSSEDSNVFANKVVLSFISAMDIRCGKRNSGGCSGTAGSSELTIIASTSAIFRATTHSLKDFTKMHQRKCLGTDLC